MSLKLDRPRPRRQKTAPLRSSGIPMPLAASAPAHKEIKFKKEGLSKELEHERMLRIEAENRLHDMTQESDSCRTRLHTLQEEFKKMEEMVQSMQQYKTKIDQLKQEKSSLSVTYENNLHKYGSHISDLERENMLLLNEVKKLESQIHNKTTDGRDKSKLLLERLRMLEKENSSLVLENEQQRQQYEKCLDEIANQVVQALLAQKMLREECMKLQNRVHDLELQNRQLSISFHQRLKLTSDTMQQHSLKGDDSTEHNLFIQGSMESLQSIFSEQMSENLASMPKMSTPPPWLQERLSLYGEQFSGDRLSIISLPGSIQSNPDLNLSQSEHGDVCCRTMIETEFPATPSSPKMKHISVFERKKEAKRSSSTSSLATPRPSKVRTRSTSSLSRARGLSLSPRGVSPSELISGTPTLTATSQGNGETGLLGNQSGLAGQPGASPTNSQENVPVTVSATNQIQSTSVPSQVQHRSSRLPTTSPLSATQSPVTMRKQASQGPNTRQTSKLPVFSNQGSQNKDLSQARRNSKGETGIRMGCQSPVSRTLSTSSEIKQPKTVSPPAGSNTNSNSVSRIPSTSKSVPKSQKQLKPTSKEKGSMNRQNSGSLSKLAAPVSGQTKQSGIKTTLKPDSKLSPPSSAKTSSVVSSITLTLSATTVTNTNSRTTSSANTSAVKGKDARTIPKAVNVSSMPKWHHEGPYANPRPETHFPRMGTTNLGTTNLGTTNLTHTSLKHESSSPKDDTLNAIKTFSAGYVPNSSTPKSELPSVKSDIFISPQSEQVPLRGINTLPMGNISRPHLGNTNSPQLRSMNNAQLGSMDNSQLSNMNNSQLGTTNNAQLGNINDSQLGSSKKGQYFYDYSDEDSDWNRPVSKDYSIASSVSLDEMLDKTLENIAVTPADTDFSSEGHFVFMSPVLPSNGSPVATVPDNVIINENNNVPSETNNASAIIESNTEEVNDNNERLRGKPDIVQDTEKREQRNMKQSITMSEITGSGIAGYRARRPKSLILGSKDKKFVYAEYGSSSSLDSTSDEDWSYQFSYAKNIKQHEIQAKVAKSLQSGTAKEIATPTNISTLEVTLNAQNDKNSKNSKTTSQLPRPNTNSKKLVKTPPPIAQKPGRKRSPSNNSIGERPKSVEICVNTALVPTITKPVTTYFPYHETMDILNEKELKKLGSEKFSTLPQAKTENGDKKIDTSDSFDEVTVERSGSRDDGYSTMSSDVQPDAMEKFSDENMMKEKQGHLHECEILENVGHQDTLRQKSDLCRDHDAVMDTLKQNTNKRDSGQYSLNLSSPTSVSSGDRHSQSGSLGRVRAMKLKYELEIQNKSPEREMNSLRSPPPTPPKSPQRTIFKETVSGGKAGSKIPLVRQRNVTGNAAPHTNVVQSKIPLNQSVNMQNKTTPNSQNKEVPSSQNKTVSSNQNKTESNSQNNTCTVPNSQNEVSPNIQSKVVPKSQNQKIPTSSQNKGTAIKEAVDSQLKTGAKSNIPSLRHQNQPTLNYLKTNTLSQANESSITNKTGTSQNVPKVLDSGKISKQCNEMTIQEQFNNLSIQNQLSRLSYFMPPSEPVSFLREGGYDSSSSTSDRGSDLTSLHISEDNILSDIPEEKEGYESSVGKLSEANSLASLSVKEVVTKHVHTCSQHQNVHFDIRFRKIWSSEDGLMRAVKEVDINKQSHDIEAFVFDDVYGETLHMETPLDRSASEADIYKKGDNPEKRWLPRLSRSRKTLSLDELTIEGRVNDIMKQMVLQQFSRTAESADSDDKSFVNYVEMLRQKGHVLDSSSCQNMEVSLQSQMSVSCSSVSPTKGHNSEEHFHSEERLSRESSCGPVGEEQKQFNSNFYSLCNVGSNHSISEGNENKIDVNQSGKKSKRTKGEKDVRHSCDKSGEECKKCLEEKNAKEFDEISRQIESLSKTVNELHHSLTSLNSENNDSGSESNEGDHLSLFNSAIGNKEIDGYQWLEDEFFLSPYGGEIILGSSPFSDTGASCDWMNYYMDDANAGDETFSEREAMQERNSDISPVEMDKKSKSNKNLTKPDKSSILAGLMDNEGNFDSQEYILQRLKDEEMKLSSEPKIDGPDLKLDFDMGAMKRRHGVKPVLKEELRITPERDVDTASTEFQKMTGGHFVDSDLGGDNLNLSQDSLDDNIGVDQVMCHRFIGKGESQAMPNKPGSRPALDFSSQFFSRYGDPEKEAVAAFDFLDDISTPVISLHPADQLSSLEVENRKSHDQDSSVSSLHGTSESSKYGSNKMKKQIFDSRRHIGSHGTGSHDLNGFAMDQSVSSTDSYMTPVKKNRRKPRSKVKKGDNANGKLPLRRISKFSSTSADESNDELSFSDSCCYHSFSSSSESLGDKV